MIRRFRLASATLALATALSLPAPARADELARDANLLLIGQLADAYSTRAVVTRPGGYEADPLARPFVRTNAATVLTAVAINLLLRGVFRHKPRALLIVAGAEMAAAGWNASLPPRRQYVSGQIDARVWPY